MDSEGLGRLKGPAAWLLQTRTPRTNPQRTRDTPMRYGRRATHTIQSSQRSVPGEVDVVVAVATARNQPRGARHCLSQRLEHRRLNPRSSGQMPESPLHGSPQLAASLAASPCYRVWLCRVLGESGPEPIETGGRETSQVLRLSSHAETPKYRRTPRPVRRCGSKTVPPYDARSPLLSYFEGADRHERGRR